MDELVIFFDTEFTDFENPKLISLGAVTADEQHEFYAEIDPLPEGCSAFVLEHIVPQLTGPKLTKEAFAQAFLTWLAGFRCDIELCSDVAFDRDLVYWLCGGYPILDGAKCTWFPLPKLVNNNPHHALEDARMLRREFASKL